MSEWGDPIPVDGKRPEWLKDNDQVHYSVPGEPGSITGQAYLMGFSKAGEYRLQADHSYYKEPNVPIEQLEREGRERGVHLSHCFQGEYEDSCKYGDDQCPAKDGATMLRLEREEEAHAMQAFLRKHDILRIGRHNENFNIYRTPGPDGYERFGCGKTVAEALENAQ